MVDLDEEERRAVGVRERFVDALTAADARPGSCSVSVKPRNSETRGFLVEVTREGKPPFVQELGEVPLDATLGDVARHAVKELALDE